MKQEKQLYETLIKQHEIYNIRQKEYLKSVFKITFKNLVKDIKMLKLKNNDEYNLIKILEKQYNDHWKLFIEA